MQYYIRYKLNIYFILNFEVFINNLSAKNIIIFESLFYTYRQTVYGLSQHHHALLLPSLCYRGSAQVACQRGWTLGQAGIRAILWSTPWQFISIRSTRATSRLHSYSVCFLDPTTSQVYCTPDMTWKNITICLLPIIFIQ